MESKKQSTPIGLTLPLRGGVSGYFEQSYDSLTQVKSNIINLLNTRIGERRMQPTFGTRLWNFVFEQSVDEIVSEILSNTIKEDIAMWIPNVTVINVESNIYKNNEATLDMYMLNVSVVFMLNMTKQHDTITILVENIGR